MQVARFKHGAEISYGIVDEAESGAGLELVQLLGDPLFQGFETTGERFPFQPDDLVAPVLPRSKALLADCAGDAASFCVVPNTAVAGPNAQLQVPEEGLFAKPGIALVVSALAKDLSEEQALSYVFGFTIATQFAVQTAAGFDTSRDGFLALGPVIETDPDVAGLRVDFGARDAASAAQEAGFALAELGFTPAAVVAAASRGRTLLPGDVIVVTATDFAPVERGEVVSRAAGLSALTSVLV